MGMGGNSQGAQKPTVVGIHVSDSIYGNVLPLVFGRARMPSQIIWLGDQIATLHKGPGKGMGGNSSTGSYYTYTVTWLAASCLGPICGVARRYTSDSGGLRRFPPTWTAANFDISHRGIIGQAPWPHLVSKHPGQDLGYTGIAYIAALNWPLGQTPMLPQETFEIFGYLPSSTSNRDSNAADVVVAILHDPFYGMQPMPAPAWNAILNGTTADGSVTWTNYGTLGKWFRGSYALKAIIIDNNFNIQVCTTAGATGAAIPAHFSQVVGGVTNDGVVRWTNYGTCSIWLPGFTYTLHTCAYDSHGTVQIVTTPGESAIAGWLDIGAGSTFADYRNYIKAYNFFISPVFDQQRPGKEWLKLIVELTHAELFWSEGELRIAPFAVNAATNNGVTWTPNITPLMTFNEDDYIIDSLTGGGPEHALLIETADPVDRHNRVKVEYTDVATDYNLDYAEQIDDNDMIVSGVRSGAPYSYHPITSGNMANEIAKLKLAQELFTVRQFTFKVPNTRAALLDPMDVIALNSRYHGMTNYPVRVVSVNEAGFTAQTHISGLGSPGDFLIEVIAEDLSSDSTPGYLPEAVIGPQSPTDPFATPGPVNNPLIFEPLVDPNNRYLLWFAASGSDGNEDWGGCNVWMSTDGGTSYMQVATITNPAQTGVLLSTLAAPPLSGGVYVEPDVSNTLSVDLTESLGTLTSIAHSEADLDSNLAFVDGELIAFADVAATATPNQFNLTYLRRGEYSSVTTAHAIGTQFVLLGAVELLAQGIARYAYAPALVGRALNFKFTSFNQYGGAEEDLATVAVYTLTVVGAARGSSGRHPDWPGPLTLVSPNHYISVEEGDFFSNDFADAITGTVRPIFPRTYRGHVMDGGVRWQNASLGPG